MDGDPNGARRRPDDVIPWGVRPDHAKEYPARMLRLLKRRREGVPLTRSEDERLDGWLSKLDRDHAVIGYNPSSVFGFYYIEKNDDTDGADGVPIRRAIITLDDQ